MRRISQAIATALSLSVAANFAQAALVDRGGGLIYDTVLNITWLQNANPAAGSIYDDGWSHTDGVMTFESAKAWAASYSYFDPQNGITYSDWRLPQGFDFGAPGGPAGPPLSGPGCDWQYSGYDCGFNMAPTSSELVHLFYVDLGNLSEYIDNTADHTVGIPRPGVIGVDWGLLNTGPFINLTPSTYWSLIVNPIDSIHEWRHFKFGNGRMSWRAVEDGGLYAWAVADGDIAAPTITLTAVPEPETYTMLVAGLGLLGFVAHRRKYKKTA